METSSEEQTPYPHYTSIPVHDATEHTHQEHSLEQPLQIRLPENLAQPTEQHTTQWSRICAATAESSELLCEQLRLVLSPTGANQLKGDYRTGKRINMKKVIQYVASQYRKDKIWLRRKKKRKREFEICVAVDDSKSMEKVGAMAMRALATISQVRYVGTMFLLQFTSILVIFRFGLHFIITFNRH